MDTLEPTLELAKQNIARSQWEQEEVNPATTTAHQFEVGELVLKFKHFKPAGSKFQPKWMGPYTIHQVYGNGAYKLLTMDGKILKSSINGNDLWKYNIQELLELFIEI